MGFLNQLGFAMWTPATRRQHSRIVTRYQTDLTDAEWRVIALLLPKPSATGRPREWPMREIVNGIFYVTPADCPWRLLPNDVPPWRERARIVARLFAVEAPAQTCCQAWRGIIDCGVRTTAWSIRPLKTLALSPVFYYLFIFQSAMLVCS